jgi:hypothetical protein
MTASFISRLKEHWAHLELAHAPGATNAEITAFEQRYGVRLSEDLRGYFRELNGLDIGHEGAMDLDLISFWRLDQVEQGKGENSDIFYFADWSIDACYYGIQLSPHFNSTTPVFLDCGGFDKRSDLVKVASSFAEFVEGYLRKDEFVLYGKTTDQPAQRPPA